LGFPPWFGADGNGVLDYSVVWVVASTNVRMSVRMASLRLENFVVSFVSKASTRLRGALNSMSSISCLFLSFFGTSCIPLFVFVGFFCQPKEACSYFVVILFKAQRKELLGKCSRAFFYFF
jgi:hypothetical protein